MRNRIVSFEYVSPAELDEHPLNWREHPNTQQAALRAVLEQIGIADVQIAYRCEETGRLRLVDGHLRKTLYAGEAKVPVVILDITDVEAKALLASHDPIGAMALRNDELYQQILDDLASEDAFGDITRMMDIDFGEEGDVDPNSPFKSNGKATYEIAPVYDEGYDAVILLCSTEQEWAQVQTLLKLKNVRDRNGKVGVSHVLTAGELFKLWPSQS